MGHVCLLDIANYHAIKYYRATNNIITPIYHMSHKASLFAIAFRIYKSKGILRVFRSGISYSLRFSRDYLGFWFHKIFKSTQTFEFRGSIFHYYYHPHGTTWKNERSVEIPVIWDIVKNYKNMRVLEVGNVLSYRFGVFHDILDKYDINRHVINEDVVRFSPQKRYDLIVSISTLEHVGWDEIPKEPRKILLAFENLKKILAPGGQLIVTLPLGYNPDMDKLLSDGEIKFEEVYYLKRFKKNRWMEVSREELEGTKYNRSIPTANGIIIGKYTK